MLWKTLILKEVYKADLSWSLDKVWMEIVFDESLIDMVVVVTSYFAHRYGSGWIFLTCFIVCQMKFKAKVWLCKKILPELNCTLWSIMYVCMINNATSSIWTNLKSKIQFRLYIKSFSVFAERENNTITLDLQ